MEQPILELHSITKRYPGVLALDDVSLNFHRGEVHAIVGENGAGKSTFIKIITGAVEPTTGYMCFEGKKIVENNPQLSLQKGISAIYQELNLFRHLSVAENIYFNRYPFNRANLIDYEIMEKNTRSVLNRLGVIINPKMLIRDLSVGYQQLVEIAKSLSRDVKVLILDEPSAALTNNELKYLYDIVMALKKESIAILYISHRLEEVFDLCDVVSVFRDGKHIKTKSVKDTSMNELIRLMVDRDLSETFPKIKISRGEKLLEVRNLVSAKVKNVSFSVYRGERLGLAGLMGAGRTETARLLFGADPLQSGEILLKNKLVKIHSPSEAIQHGIVYLSEDRKQQGLFLKMSVNDNVLFAYLPILANRMKLISKEKEKRICKDQIYRLAIKTPSPKQQVCNLSGGNQQKVILAKWMLMNYDLIIFDEPTRGIDVGAKQEIYKLMNMLTQQGKAVVMISSEMPELLGMSDRVIVMHEGTIAGELSKEEMTQEKVLKLASGV